jgi:EAL domain-containing protein (putative c-di-GMP-specific phosphodiesterase class I)
MKAWNYAGGATDMTARTIEIRLPEDAQDIEMVYSYGDYLRSLEEGHKWMLYARTVDMQYLKRRIDVDVALRKAIEADSFEMYYQPIYHVESQSIDSGEALVRLYDSELGRISPGEFIPIAEQGGLILQMSEIIFRKVFSFISNNELFDKGVKYLEVNLSMVQCMQESFADKLQEMMKEYGIASNRINLEVTETAAVSMPRRLRENMGDLYERGIRFSLDDFGTGYSNIDSLMDLPLDMVKLDKSMIDMATASDHGKLILASAIAMVKQVKMKIVAEGVETVEQKEFLEQMKVDYLQGYYFSRPLPEEDFVKFVEEFNKVG